jgi:hypothetical protein
VARLFATINAPAVMAAMIPSLVRESLRYLLARKIVRRLMPRSVLCWSTLEASIRLLLGFTTILQRETTAEKS